MPNSQILTRRVEKILPIVEGLEKLMGERKIRLYQGFDPTGGRLHLGHSIGIRKLMDFANAGHEVIFLFGTGTVLVGDPSQRAEARKTVTEDEIQKNIQGWKDQVAPLVDWNKITVRENADWLLPLTLKDIITVASNISAVQLFKREMFQRRLEKGDSIWYHETMYPLLQGYDSVAMDVDLEIGGTDQEFNMLIGRELQRKMNNKEKYVLTVPMIVGTDGQQMSKTSGNCVWLNDPPQDMFGKLMSLPDEQIIPYMELVTDIPLERVEEVKNGIKNGNIKPMEAKKELAMAVVTQLHSRKDAEQARGEFEEVFQKRQIPINIPIYSPKPGESIVDILVSAGISKSKSEAKQILAQGGIELNGQKITDPNLTPTPGTLKIGKHRFLELKNAV